MATVVRLKRRRNEDPLEVLLLAAKRHRGATGQSSTTVPTLDRNVFKFAGTVASKDDGISVPVRDAIRKEKLEREYKQHQARIFGDVRQETRQQFRQKTQQNRLKVTFKHRALELNSLDNVDLQNESANHHVCSKCGLSISAETDKLESEEIKEQKTTTELSCSVKSDNRNVNLSKGNDEANSIDSAEANTDNDKENEDDANSKNSNTSVTKGKQSLGKDIGANTCKCKGKTAESSASANNKSVKHKEQTGASPNNTGDLNADNGSVGDGPVFCLVDMETDNDKTRQSGVSSLADQITCNSEPMVREIVTEHREDDYVYDIYYTNSREFDFRLFERDLTFEAFNSDMMLDRAGDDDDFVYGDDNDDENAESNWRNDYPDEDPQHYEADRYDYTNDLTEYEAFETETGDQLADWMSWRCNIDAGELSSEDDNDVNHYGDKGSSYDAYYRRVKKDMAEDDSDNDTEDIDIL